MAYASDITPYSSASWDANTEAVASHPDTGPMWSALIDGEIVEYDDLDQLGECDIDALEQALRVAGMRLDGAGGFGWRATPITTEDIA